MTNAPAQATPSRCTIDGNCRTKHAVLARIARDLAFPEHAANNLDALYDVLTTDIPGPIEITWSSPASSRRHLGADYDAILKTLRAAAKERHDVTVKVA